VSSAKAIIREMSVAVSYTLSCSFLYLRPAQLDKVHYSSVYGPPASLLLILYSLFSSSASATFVTRANSEAPARPTVRPFLAVSPLALALALTLAIA
jgi:hypothetical protein